MRRIHYITAILIACGLIIAPLPSLDAADEAVCYASAEGNDQLVSSWRTGGGFVDIGDFGSGNDYVEAIAFDTASGLLYGADADELGTIDITTAVFTPVGGTFGTADGVINGVPTTVNITDVDGLAFDRATGILYGAERQGADDLLIQIDPATGLVVQNAFGPGLDYVVILASPITGFPDIDDLAIDPTDGQMYGISNDGGVGDHLIKIDKTDGSVIDVGAFLGTDDMEGLSVSPDGNIFGTTGTGGNNSLWDIDKITGFATLVFAYPSLSDYEGVACMRSNVITGTVFIDSDTDAILDAGERGLTGVTVRLYRDDGTTPGAVDGSDTLLQTVISPASGFYEFFISSFGDYVIDIDITTLPSGWTLTTDNLEVASFTNYGNVDSGNDFGAIGSAVALNVSKADGVTSACPGEVITYTVEITNTSGTTQTGIGVSDALPTGATYVPNSTIATGIAAVSTIRVTEYYLAPGSYSGTVYDLTLDQDLVQNYFVIIQGSDGDGDSGGDVDPDENYARLTQDPFGTGDLAVSADPDVLRFEREDDNGGTSWVGVVTVVECLADCSTAGFTLLSVESVTAANGDSSDSDTSATAWSDIGQVMLMGGFNGAGCYTPDGDPDDTPVCHKRIWPSGSNTINWSRNTNNGNDNWATSTVMVLEWGSEWTVQRVRVEADPADAGNGVNATSEYETRAISSVARDNTWVWGTGWTDDNGPGDSAEGVVITLGDGVNQNANESSVAVGLEHANNAIDFEVYTLTHNDLAVDYRFKADGDNGALGVNLAIDSAGSERMALSYNGANDTGNNHPRSMFSARYLTDSAVRLERRRSGTSFPAWVQGIDFTGIGSGTASVTKDNVAGGANPDLVDGVPPDLVTTADGFQIAPGGTMTVTFQATVDNPYNGAPNLRNAVTGTSAEGGFDTADASASITLATIGNLVWHDFHPNDVQDPSEPGIPDVPVTVYGPGPDSILGTGDDVYVASTFTDANGNYSFPNLGPGDYRVEVNDAWLDVNGYPDLLYPDNPYWDLGAGLDLAALTCGGSELAADFGYWDGITVPVTLSSFQTSEGRGATLFEWTTATQAGTVGFNLYAVSGAGRRRINSELIPAHSPDSVVPQSYQFRATVGDADQFVIEDVDILGRRRRHGPFAKELQHGLDPRDAPERPVDWPSIRGEHREKAAERRRTRGLITPDDGFAATKSMQVEGRRRGGDRRAPSSGIARLLVETDGVYRVTYEDLLKAGFDLAGVDAERFALIWGGEAVPIRVLGGAVFGPGSSVEWVAEGLDTLYTTTNVYTLSFESQFALRVGVDWREPNYGSNPPEHYSETTIAERNRRYSFAAPNGDPWYDTAILAYTEPKSEEFKITVDDLVEDGDNATLRVEMWGTTGWPEYPDHHVEIGFNGVPVADELFDGLVDYPLEIELPVGLLEEGTNTLELTLPGDTGVAYDMVTFDSFSVTYPRRFVARGGRLDFEVAAETLRVEGFTSPHLLVYRIKGNTVTLLAGREVALDAGRYVATFRGSAKPARYLVTATAGIGSPQIEAVRDRSSILRGRASYLVISHPDFIDGLEPLVAAREDEGWRVKVADVEDVYAEFSHGLVDPEAIKSYIAFAAEHIGIEMVLLVGGDTYDYHDILGLGSLSFIPSLYAQTDEIVRFAPADPLFTDIDNDGLPDLPIGRLPVRTSAELQAVIDKTLDYAAKSYPRTGVFAADKDDAAAESFTAISNSFISSLPGGWSVATAYLEELSVDDARTRLFGGINQGAALTSYFGHSGPTVWSFDSLFHVSDAALLENHRMPTVVTQWGCWNTYYVEPTNNTMGHALLLSGDQGAAAVLGASTLTESASDQALGELFIPRLIEPGMTLGGALQEAKDELALESPGRLDVLLGWTLLGDPALVVEP